MSATNNVVKIHMVTVGHHLPQVIPVPKRGRPSRAVAGDDVNASRPQMATSDRLYIFNFGSGTEQGGGGEPPTEQESADD